MTQDKLLEQVFMTLRSSKMNSEHDGRLPNSDSNYINDSLYILSLMDRLSCYNDDVQDEKLKKWGSHRNYNYWHEDVPVFFNPITFDLDMDDDVRHSRSEWHRSGSTTRIIAYNFIHFYKFYIKDNKCDKTTVFKLYRDFIREPHCNAHFDDVDYPWHPKK